MTQKEIEDFYDEVKIKTERPVVFRDFYGLDFDCVYTPDGYIICKKDAYYNHNQIDSLKENERVEAFIEVVISKTICYTNLRLYFVDENLDSEIVKFTGYKRFVCHGFSPEVLKDQLQKFVRAKKAFFE